MKRVTKEKRENQLEKHILSVNIFNLFSIVIFLQVFFLLFQIPYYLFHVILDLIIEKFIFHFLFYRYEIK